MWWNASRSLMIVALVLTGGAAGARAEMVLLQQNLPNDQAGTALLLVDRSRLSHVAVSKGTTTEHRFTLHLATEPRTELTFTCNDAAIARQVLDAIRMGGAATLDVTGRCRL